MRLSGSFGIAKNNGFPYPSGRYATVQNVTSLSVFSLHHHATAPTAAFTSVTNSRRSSGQLSRQRFQALTNLRYDRPVVDPAMKGSPFEEDELKVRRPVWLALSDLFLDTDTTLLEPQIVRTLAASPYSEVELERILVREVQPVCWPNVFWWEWAGFDPEWLEAQITKRRTSMTFLAMWLYYPLTHWLNKYSPQWRRILRNVAAERRRLGTAG